VILQPLQPLESEVKNAPCDAVAETGKGENSRRNGPPIMSRAPSSIDTQICLLTVLPALIRMIQRTFTVRLRKDEESGYYAARCVELPEAISQCKTEEEALTNVREALELVLEEYESEAKKEGGKLIPIVV